MNKDKLIKVFNKGKETNSFVQVEVTIPGQEGTEFIVNKPSSIDNKLEYYLRTYDDELKHCMNDKVIIVDASYFDEDKQEWIWSDKI